MAVKHYFRTLLALTAALMLCTGLRSAPAQSWKFAVMSDTQWIGNDDGKNPNSVAVDIIRQLNQQFISQGVKFVIQVGDLTDSGSAIALNTTAVFRQELYNAGIGFWPLRGNHESSMAAANQFVSLFPQTTGGFMNDTPGSAFGITTDPGQPIPRVSGPRFFAGTISPIPTAPTGFTGLCYAFDYSNARFVLLDQFTPTTGAAHSTVDANQVAWVGGQLAGRPGNTHAFVFGHKGIITENHVDTLFGSDPSKDVADQDAFITSLDTNGVRYYIQGHDHMHNRSLVSVTTGTPTDGISPKVENVLLASDSSKFYTPGNTVANAGNPLYPGIQSNDDKFDVPVFGHKRQAQIAQELHTIGYYIFTVNGPRVTAEFYSTALANVAPAGCSGPNCEWLIPSTPTLNFIRTETFGYSMNGREFLVCEAGQPNCNSSYTQIADTFNGTNAQILSGVNGSAARDFDNRNFIKTVDTGWTPAKANQMASAILTLWGMADLGTERTDVYTLSMNYDAKGVGNGELKNGTVGLATRDDDGNWINAVDMNFGGAKQFVYGPWDASYKLGTYGIDQSTHTAWAVVNYNGDFVVAKNISPVQSKRGN